MKTINELLKKYHLKPLRYEKNGHSFIIDTSDGRFVLKEKANNLDIYRYLESRSFHYYPENISSEEDEYDIYPYIEEYIIPDEQKLLDLIDLVSLLHNKTTHYKEISEDEYKKIYEDIQNKISFLETYNSDKITIIESKVYPSPAEYLFERNITKLFSALTFCKEELEKWYEKVKLKQKKRLVIIHNDLRLNHFLRNENSYLISWNKSRIDMPIFDLYKLYKNEGLEVEFASLLERYERNYPLLNEERDLLFILMSLPDKVDFVGKESEKCEIITKMIDYIYKTESIISPYYTKEEES